MKDNKTTKYLLTALVVLVAVLVITRGFTYAKYISNAVFNYYLTSKGFYFNSDDLSTNIKKNTDTSWDGNSIYFTINNNANNSLATEYDIKYKITCQVEEENTTKVCYLNGTTSSTQTATLSKTEGCSNYKNDNVDTTGYNQTHCIEKGYTWEAKKTTATHYFDIVDTTGKDVDTATVIITATSTSPYQKTLTGKYILNKDKNELGTISLKYETKTNYENIIITNSYNEDKCLKLTWDSSKLVIDLSDETIKYSTDDNNYINELIFTLEKKNSKNFIFYKNDSTKTYNEEDFTLVESSECE